MKRKGDRYSMQTSLIVATLKRLLPVGLNICAPGEQELITLAKNRFTQVRLISVENQSVRQVKQIHPRTVSLQPGEHGAALHSCGCCRRLHC